MIDFSSFKSSVRHRLGELWTRHTEASRINRELADSSDRVLAEIGLSRGDIDSVAHGRFRKA